LLLALEILRDLLARRALHLRELIRGRATPRALRIAALARARIVLTEALEHVRARSIAGRATTWIRGRASRIPGRACVGGWCVPLLRLLRRDAGHGDDRCGHGNHEDSHPVTLRARAYPRCCEAVVSA